MTSDLCTSPSKRSHDNSSMSPDIEDIGQQQLPPQKKKATPPRVTKHPLAPSQLNKNSWKDILGPPPDRGTTKVGVVLWVGTVS